MPTLPLTFKACAAILGLIAGGSLAGAQELQKVRASILPLADVAPFYVALEHGYFKDEGLQVEPTPSIGGAIAIPSLVSGAIDVAYNNVVSALLAKAQGLDVKMIAGATRVLLQRSGMIARKGDGVTGPADLAGKVVAVNNRNNMMWLYARAWTKDAGADPDRISFREVPFPQMNDALRQKQVDAIYVVDPFQANALQDGSLVRLGNPNELQPDVVPGVYVASGQFISRNGGDTIERYLRAMTKANNWYNANKDSSKVNELIASYSKIKPEVVVKMAKGDAFNTLDVESIRKTAKLMVEHKMLPSVDVDDAVYIKR